MGARGRTRPRRAKIASDAVDGLARVWRIDPSSEVAQAAGSAMLRTARRNRVRIPGELRMRSCRSCRKMLDSSNVSITKPDDLSENLGLIKNKYVLSDNQAQAILETKGTTIPEEVSLTGKAYEVEQHLVDALSLIHI